VNTYPTALETILIEEVQSFFKKRFVDTLTYDSTANFDDNDCYSAKIAISSANINGYLGVNANPKTLKECHPERRYGDEITDEDLEDWVGEIANRVLGNMKNRLLELGIETTLNPPVFFHGPYRGEADMEQPLATYVFHTEMEYICFTLQLDCSEISFGKSA
jgi:hypothetical protein